jgi:putative transposase
VDRSNLRWCSDGFEIGCDNGEKVRVAVECCDREAIGQVNRLTNTIEWLSDNGSGYIAHETRVMARDIGREPRTTPSGALNQTVWRKPS